MRRSIEVKLLIIRARAQHIFESVYPSLNIPIDIITVYNSGGIIYDYTKSFEEYTKCNVVYITPMVLGYNETFLFLSIFVLMYAISMHFQFKYDMLSCVCAP